MEKKEEKWSKRRASERIVDRLDRIVCWSTEVSINTLEKIRFAEVERERLCEMANMPGVGLEIFNAGGGWRDQKWAPSWSVKLPSLRQGRVQTLPCSLS
ncbi:hypothetical protein T08_5363 [Trichinella sp. T8]|nr:hypothetical protein T08_5363 [Trichinella sp. T8]